MIRAVSSTGVTLPVGGAWVIEVETFDADGYLSDDSPVITITRPDATTATPTVEHVSTGRYRATYTLAAAGRHVAEATVTGDVVALAAYGVGATTAAGMPTVDDVADYLREFAASWETEDLQSALDAEAAAQRSVCRVRAVYPADLRQALLRRVQRNLAMRQLPLAVLQGDAEAGTAGAMPPGRDPEVRRLEGPHRRTPVG